jgi:hypothetical protein
MEGELISAAQVRKFLPASRKWIYAHGIELGGVKIGGKWFFTEQGVRDALQRRNEMASSNQAGRGSDSTEARLPAQKRRGRLGKANPTGVERRALAERAGFGDFV